MRDAPPTGRGRTLAQAVAAALAAAGIASGAVYQAAVHVEGGEPADAPGWTCTVQGAAFHRFVLCRPDVAAAPPGTSRPCAQSWQPEAVDGVTVMRLECEPDAGSPVAAPVAAATSAATPDGGPP